MYLHAKEIIFQFFLRLPGSIFVVILVALFYDWVFWKNLHNYSNRFCMLFIGWLFYSQLERFSFFRPILIKNIVTYLFFYSPLFVQNKQRTSEVKIKSIWQLWNIKTACDNSSKQLTAFKKLYFNVVSSLELFLYCTNYWPKLVKPVTWHIQNQTQKYFLP